MCKWYIFAILFSLSFTCNNYCNGHGKCGSGDKCACFMGWGGADCSLRSCPYDDAFVDLPLGDINHNGKVSKDDDAKDEWRPNGGIKEDLSDYVTSTRAHRYAECSNAGLCNRNTGECECFPGYEGSACQRRGCPVGGDNGEKVCSGHGVCLTSTTIIHDADSTGTAYYGWESEKYMSCLCDSGWEGIDCSMRQCPKGFDPVVLAGVTFNYRIQGNNGNGLSTAVAADNFYLQFTYDGMVYQTPTISKIETANYPTCKDEKIDFSAGKPDSSTLSQITENIRRVIVTNVPYLNQATVSFVCGKEGGGNAVSGTNAADLLISTPHGDVKIFGVSTGADPKNKLEVYKVGNNIEKVSPTITIKMISTDDKEITYDSTNKKVQVTDSSGTAKDTDAYALCSRRGKCESDTGECTCFPGYNGEACQYQRSIAI